METGALIIIFAGSVLFFALLFFVSNKMRLRERLTMPQKQGLVIVLALVLIALLILLVLYFLLQPGKQNVT